MSKQRIIDEIRILQMHEANVGAAFYIAHRTEPGEDND